MADKSTTIEGYLAQVREDQREALEALRALIRMSFSGAEEGFSYGLPAFRLEGRPLVAYGASKNHCSLYPMSPAVIEQFKDNLASSETSKGTIRFAPENPLPDDLVRRLVEARIAELQKREEEFDAAWAGYRDRSCSVAALSSQPLGG